MWLQSKTILIISPQSWGTMFLSKHHYAVELARHNEVYFLAPPDVPGPSYISISGSEIQNLSIIRHGLSFPYNLKFHWPAVFHWFMKTHVKKIVEQIGKPIHIVWSFDLGWLYPFRLFPKSLKVFHPVDEPLNPTAIRSGTGAQVIFSVTNEILDKYSHLRVPRYFINHGISQNFLEHHPAEPKKNLHVGLSGNLLRPDIDRSTLLTIIEQHPNIIFDCFGSFESKQSNIGGDSDPDTVQFIDALKTAKNVVLHGVVSTGELPQRYATVDAWLICYDVLKDQSKGTNYHKVMEFISTGKPIISNNITTYEGRNDLVQMVHSRIDNKELPELFHNIISHLHLHSTASLQQLRKEFAAENTYTKQIERISDILEHCFFSNKSEAK